MAPLVSAIREPQGGGSQAFVSDLARGLAGRGHEVHVYAATGSQIPGVTVIDTGVDPGSLAATLYRAVRPGRAATRPRPGRPLPAPTPRSRENRYDLIHNHAFDAPAISLAAELGPPVVHTLHLPPDAAIAAALGQAALRQAARGGQPPAVACVSAFQASIWRAVARVDAILPPYVATRSVPWSDTAGDGVVFAGRLSPEKGAAEAIDIAQAAGARIDVYGDVYDAGYARDQIAPRRDAARRRGASGSAPHLHVGGHGPRGGRGLPGPLGRALRHGRRRRPGVRDSRRRVQARWARRDSRGRRDRLPGRAR